MGLARKSVLFFILSLFFLFSSAVQARSHHSHDAATISTIAIADLPQEARDTLQLIKKNGPFPYPRDGVVFGNYEHVLPLQQRGYYHEYTVKTPGAHNRGARRIVCGIVPKRSAEKSSERDDAQGARSGTTETYHEGGRESEHRATQRNARAAILSELLECYYTENHYRNFYRIREGR